MVLYRLVKRGEEGGFLVKGNPGEAGVLCLSGRRRQPGERGI